MSHKDDNAIERTWNAFQTQFVGGLYQATLDLYDIGKDLGGEVIGSLVDSASESLNKAGYIDDESLDNLQKVADGKIIKEY